MFSFSLRLYSLFILATFVGCGSQTNTSDDPLQQQINQLVFVAGGTFTMGDAGYTDKNGQFKFFTGYDDDGPAHVVKLSSYSIQKYEVTFKEFDYFSTINKRELLKQEYRDQEFMQANYPAQAMTWQQARDYCQWLGDRLGYSMDLPTEAQWEYAARSRGLMVGYATNDSTYARGRNVRDPVKVKYEMPVGSWPPNPLGIYDMTGNVDEWTLDL